MRDPSQYYSQFEGALAKQDPIRAEKFRSLVETRSLRQVYLWLDDLRRKGLLPEELDQSLNDFYSQFF
jgi:hypothetical protein